MATYTGGEGLKSMRCGAMAAKRGLFFLIHTKGAQGLAVSLPDCLVLPAAQSQWNSPSQQWSLLVPQAKTRGTQHGWGMPASLLWTWESAGGGMMSPSHVLVLWVLGDLRSLPPPPPQLFTCRSSCPQDSLLSAHPPLVPPPRASSSFHICQDRGGMAALMQEQL